MAIKEDEIFDNTRRQEPNGTGAYADVAAKHFKRSGGLATVLTTILMAVLPLTVSGQSGSAATIKDNFAFESAADNTQGFSSFGSAPAINNAGAIAFESTGNGFPLGNVWKWQNGRLTPIATTTQNTLGSFGDAVVINSAGTVGFNARVLAGNDTIIATGNGGALNKIASAGEQGLIGGPFLGISAINERGTVVFLGLRRGGRSQAIFAGSGGPLTAIVDTATDSNFDALGNSAISASGKVVFSGFPPDQSVGIFLSAGDRIVDIIDTNNPSFFNFLDPVMNDSGTVASGAFLSAGGMAVFTASAAGIIPRTDTLSFALIDTVSINNSGDVAFFAAGTAGGEGLFAELTGGSRPVPVIETGDALFGSTVVAVTMGRFSLNDRGQLAFHYQLADGRSGIALAYRQH